MTSDNTRGSIAAPTLYLMNQLPSDRVNLRHVETKLKLFHQSE